MSQGAFINSGSAMMAMSDAMGTISQNIANVNTVGYKDAETLFKTNLSETLSTANGGTNSFGVKGYVRNLLDNQGLVSATSNWSDLAINGEGFFIVSNSSASVDTTGASVSDLFFTRAGDFQTTEENGRSYLTTSGGLYVLGWMADGDGNIDTSNAIGPLYYEPNTEMAGKATSTISLTATIPADADLTASSGTTQFSVEDYYSDAKTVSVSWQRLDGDQWQGTFSVDDGSGTVVNDVVNVTVDGNGTVVDPSSDSLDLVFDWGVGTTDQSVTLSDLLPSTSSEMTSVTVYDSSGTAHGVNLNFERTGSNQWYLRMSSSDGSIGSLSASDATASAGGYSIPVTFDSDGNIETPSTLSFTATWDDATTNTVSLDLSKVTQLSTDDGIVVKSREQDGYAGGSLQGLEFTSEGNLVGQFDNGETRTLMRLPVATFVAPNQLDPISGTLFQATAAAGAMTIQSVADNTDATSFSPTSLEASTVDLEDQFSRMIMTQHAYSSNSQVFKTADEMLTTLRDIL